MSNQKFYKRKRFKIACAGAVCVTVCALVFAHFSQSKDIAIIGGADGPTMITISKKDKNAAVFSATVLEKNENSIIVQPSADSREIKSADKISVSLDGIDENVKSTLRSGVEIAVAYDGVIQETYPAAITNVYYIEVAE